MATDANDQRRRSEFMAKKGDDWLLTLFYSEREHKNMKIKHYLDHDSLVDHEARKA